MAARSWTAPSTAAVKSTPTTGIPRPSDEVAEPAGESPVAPARPEAIMQIRTIGLVLGTVGGLLFGVCRASHRGAEKGLPAASAGSAAGGPTMRSRADAHDARAVQYAVRALAARP